MIKKILVATDGSEHADRALDLAADLAAPSGAELIVLHVMRRAGSGRVPEELEALARIEHVEVTERDMLQGVAQAIVEAAAARVRQRGLSKLSTRISIGDPAHAVVQAAQEAGADLIVIGRRGLGALGGALLGSVSLKVLQLAEAPVATVR